ncbi:circadian clock-controlled protein daywake-like [Athalia rosae]|uniref:circadian clock-controlled protein daywake-like n=1 Tax=Athalia rosae TaxID=37344 RepID=UPI00203332D7|nr:circadian clock-controlled protein daywake-like [Athalia rosae]
MTVSSVLVESLVFLSVLATALASLPPGVMPCSTDGDLETYNNCVLQQVAVLRPYLPKGIASLKLPALDPLLLPSLTIDRNLDALKIKANMTQVHVYGVSNFLIDELKAHPKDLSVEMTLSLPELQVNGDYDIQGRILLLPLSGVGNFKGNFSGTKAHVMARGKETADKNGIQRVEIDDIELKIRVGDGTLTLKAPPRHTLAADAAAAFFNSNPRLVLDIASPIIEDTAVTISKALAARALGVLTKQEILP